MPGDISDMSIVFHCGTSSAERAFCASFQNGGEHEYEKPDQGIYFYFIITHQTIIN